MGKTSLQSMQEAAAWIYQADTAVVPPIPTSPHVHMVGALTPQPPQPLPEPLKALCDSAGSKGVVLVSMGTTAVPGKHNSALNENDVHTSVWQSC